MWLKKNSDLARRSASFAYFYGKNFSPTAEPKKLDAWKTKK